MEIKALVNSKGTIRVLVNSPKSFVSYPFDGKEVDPQLLGEISITENTLEEFSLEGIQISIPLSLEDHVFGLGEKAFSLDRKRLKLQMWNVDVGAVSKYGWHTDPMYKSIPFFIIISANAVKGYFVNSPTKLIFDFGFEDYSKIKIYVPEKSVELFVFNGKSVEEIIENYTELTGKPFDLPIWALGYQISRYSYFPQKFVVEVVKKHIEKGFNVSSIYLDIHYMDDYKIFTWSKERFPDPKGLSNTLHDLGVRLVTILNPCVKVDQHHGDFKDAVKEEIIVDDKKGIFVGSMWAGECSWIDFFNEKAREWWKEKVKQWISDYGVDGIWLDMNEPTAFGTYMASLPFHSIHHTHEGEATHFQVRNAYPYYQALATFEGLKEAGIEKPFILTRSAYAGIQKYAAVWTGDNYATWDDLKLQTVLALGLSISGVPYVGCDIGAFMGRGKNTPPVDLDLIVKYYETALFFPFFRAHKATDGIDQEPYNLPSIYSEKIMELIRLREKFLPYLSSLVRESNITGHPILRPLVYKYFNDYDVYKIDDEYLVGDYLLYAPILSKDKERELYLPPGKWISFWSEDEYDGKKWISASGLPIFIAWNSLIPLKSRTGLDFVIYGQKGKITLYDGNTVEFDGNMLKTSQEVDIDKIIIKGKTEKAIEIGKRVNKVNISI
ncbi:alpha-glucosidase MalA [Acidianus sp. RZ1]|uniref:alpha-glucosidase MalA n=1 Tax=Acidianus sp. RZ1 TaxID=1540082 RepID=UPI0014924B5B|nr:alpha-glucosidase MalA [Acidianus sp. RZ1]NON63216.1 glycoside hydrolase family 31 protein [Acidianus sp. RZ1]